MAKQFDEFGNPVQSVSVTDYADTNTGNATPGAPYNYGTARTKLEQKLGKTLTDQDVDEAFAKFGGNKDSMFTDESLAPVAKHFQDKWASAYTPPPATGAGGGAPGPTSNPQNDLMAQLLKDMTERTNQTKAQRDSLMSRINGLADKYSQPVTADDPNIAPLANSYTANIDRGTKRYQEKMAERAHAEGVGSGAFDSAIGGAITSGARAAGDFGTQLMRDESLSRRSALTDTIGQGSGLLSAQDNADISSRLGGLDAANKSRGLDITESQGNQKLINDLFLGKGNLDLGQKSLDLQKLLGMGDLDLRKLLGMGQLAIGQGGNANQARSIDNQNQQWYDKFAYDAGHDSGSMDDLLMALLLGGG